MDALFSPLCIGNAMLRNRIVMPAMHLNYTPTGEVTDRLIAFYTERARGGAGLILIGGCRIDAYSGGEWLIGLDDERFIPGLRRLALAVKAHGACIGAQLYQAGRYAHSALIGRQALAPSAVTSHFTREEPREMTLEEIHGVIEAYATAAARVKAAGLDVVEVIASAGYLISQFLSPVTNLRGDAYGGDLKRRMRFGIEVAEAIRGAVGEGYPVIFRIAGNDFIPGSHTNREAQSFALALEHAGVDAFNVTGGWHETRIPQIPMEVPRGAYVYLARGIKEAVKKPVIACNRITDPRAAQAIIREGLADMVGFARGLIADPELPNKARAGRCEDIVSCIGCNQGCFDRLVSLGSVACMVNPRAGREEEFPSRAGAGKGQTLVVAGGGPAGLSAAISAATAGLRVVLFEESERPGGQLHLAGALQSRDEFNTLVRVLTRQAHLSGVEIRTGTRADAASVGQERPMAVVVATGGCPIMPGIPGAEGQNVVQAWDVLAGRASVGKEVVIIGGGAVGSETGILLAQIGTIDAATLEFLFLHQAEEVETLKRLATCGIKGVTIIEMLPRLGTDIGLSNRWVELQMLRRYHVHTLVSTKASAIVPEGVLVEQDGSERLIACDTVVLAVGTRRDDSLVEKVRPHVPQVVTVGDARRPRKAFEAIHEGFEAGYRVAGEAPKG